MNIQKNLEYFFLLFRVKKNNIVSSSSSNFPVKLICSGILAFISLDEPIPISL